MRSNLDIIEHAFRRLGIKAEDEELSADQRAYAGRVLENLTEELSTITNVGWSCDEVPERLSDPLANLLAADIAPSYGVPSQPRGRALLRLLAQMREDDRDPETINAAPVYY